MHHYFKMALSGDSKLHTNYSCAEWRAGTENKSYGTQHTQITCSCTKTRVEDYDMNSAQEFVFVFLVCLFVWFCFDLGQSLTM